MGLLCGTILIGVTLIFLSRSDALDPMAYFLIAMLTWPWVFVIGGVVGHLLPQVFFEDEKQD